jgi:hypothetical protein
MLVVSGGNGAMLLQRRGRGVERVGVDNRRDAQADPLRFRPVPTGRFRHVLVCPPDGLSHRLRRLDRLQTSSLCHPSPPEEDDPTH